MEQKTEQMHITKDTTIGEIVDKHPEVVETLMSYGVHCVGCHVSPFESLEMGFKGHGMSDDDVNEAIAALNEVIEKSKNHNESADETIHLTRNAAEKIKSLTKKGNKSGLRIHIEKGGCSGYTYEMEVAEKKNGDFAFNEHGVNIFIDKESFDKLKGSYVDYLDSLQGAGFKIKNPKEWLSAPEFFGKRKFNRLFITIILIPSFSNSAAARIAL